MDAGMTVADVASLALLYNTLGVQPDDAPAADRMPMDVPYKVDVPQRETITLKAPRAVPMPGKGANNPRTFGLCPKLAAARNGSGYVNQISMLGKTGRARDRELLILRIGWNSQSEYEWSEHVGPVGEARKMGLPIERITMGPDAPGWDPFEANLLRFADEMYRDACRVGPHVDCPEAALRRPDDDRRDDHPGELPDGLAGTEYSGRPEQSWRRETTAGAVAIDRAGTEEAGGSGLEAKKPSQARKLTTWSPPSPEPRAPSPVLFAVTRSRSSVSREKTPVRRRSPNRAGRARRHGPRSSNPSPSRRGRA